jgi:TPR repeat protein
MVAACYYRGMSIPENKGKAKEYAKRAYDAGSIEGTFWLGRCQDTWKERFPFFKQAADQNHLPGKFHFGFWTFKGRGIPKNKKRGKEIIDEVFNLGEIYWTFLYVQYVENGSFGFTGNANAIYAKARSQPIADCSLFNPWGISCSELKAKW